MADALLAYRTVLGQALCNWHGTPLVRARPAPAHALLTGLFFRFPSRGAHARARRPAPAFFAPSLQEREMFLATTRRGLGVCESAHLAALQSLANEAQGPSGSSRGGALLKQASLAGARGAAAARRCRPALGCVVKAATGKGAAKAAKAAAARTQPRQPLLLSAPDNTAAAAPAAAPALNPWVGRSVSLLWLVEAVQGDASSATGVWYDALVTDFRGGAHCVAYDVGTPAEEFEWVNLDALAPDLLRPGPELAPGALAAAVAARSAAAAAAPPRVASAVVRRGARTPAARAAAATAPPPTPGHAFLDDMERRIGRAKTLAQTAAVGDALAERRAELVAQLAVLNADDSDAEEEDDEEGDAAAAQ
jgi:hypothetical protein